MDAVPHLDRALGGLARWNLGTLVLTSAWLAGSYFFAEEVADALVPALVILVVGVAGNCVLVWRLQRAYR